MSSDGDSSSRPGSYSSLRARWEQRMRATESSEATTKQSPEPASSVTRTALPSWTRPTTTAPPVEKYVMSSPESAASGNREEYHPASVSPRAEIVEEKSLSVSAARSMFGTSVNRSSGAATAGSASRAAQWRAEASAGAPTAGPNETSVTVSDAQDLFDHPTNASPVKDSRPGWLDEGGETANEVAVEEANHTDIDEAEAGERPAWLQSEEDLAAGIDTSEPPKHRRQESDIDPGVEPREASPAPQSPPMIGMIEEDDDYLDVSDNYLHANSSTGTNIVEKNGSDRAIDERLGLERDMSSAYGLGDYDEEYRSNSEDGASFGSNNLEDMEPGAETSIDRLEAEFVAETLDDVEKSSGPMEDQLVRPPLEPEDSVLSLDNTVMRAESDRLRRELEAEIDEEEQQKREFEDMYGYVGAEADTTAGFDAVVKEEERIFDEVQEEDWEEEEEDLHEREYYYNGAVAGVAAGTDDIQEDWGGEGEDLQEPEYDDNGAVADPAAGITEENRSFRDNQEDWGEEAERDEEDWEEESDDASDMGNGVGLALAAAATAGITAGVVANNFNVPGGETSAMETDYQKESYSARNEENLEGLSDDNDDEFNDGDLAGFNDYEAEAAMIAAAARRSSTEHVRPSLYQEGSLLSMNSEEINAEANRMRQEVADEVALERQSTLETQDQNNNSTASYDYCNESESKRELKSRIDSLHEGVFGSKVDKDDDSVDSGNGRYVAAGAATATTGAVVASNAPDRVLGAELKPDEEGNEESGDEERGVAAMAGAAIALAATAATVGVVAGGTAKNVDSNEAAALGGPLDMSAPIDFSSPPPDAQTKEAYIGCDGQDQDHEYYGDEDIDENYFQDDDMEDRDADADGNKAAYLAGGLVAGAAVGGGIAAAAAVNKPPPVEVEDEFSDYGPKDRSPSMRMQKALAESRSLRMSEQKQLPLDAEKEIIIENDIEEEAGSISGEKVTFADQVEGSQIVSKTPKDSSRRRKSLCLLCFVLLAVIGAAVGLSLYFVRPVTSSSVSVSGFSDQVGGTIDGPDRTFEYGSGLRSEFGKSVAISSKGDRIAIGAPGYTASVYSRGQRLGLVQVFEEQSGDWVLLEPSILGDLPGEAAGTAVSLSGDGMTLAVGSPTYLDDIVGGQVILYEYDDGAWEQFGSPLIGDDALDRFGSSVSLSDDGSRVAVSQPTDNGFGRRVVKVYERQTDDWEQIGNDIVGRHGADPVSMSAEGRVVALGALSSADNDYAAAVGIYRYDSRTSDWDLLGDEIEMTGVRSFDTKWMPSLSADGRTVAIGSAVENPDERDPNRRYNLKVEVYRYDGFWEKRGQTILDESSNGLIYYPVSLSADGLSLAVGNPSAGRAQIFRFVDREWVPIDEELKGTNKEDSFGFDVAISSDGSRVAVGAPTSRVLGQQRGSAYVFSN